MRIIDELEQKTNWEESIRATSTRHSTSRSVRFVNYLDIPASVYWNGNELVDVVARAGGESTHSSFVGHRFIVRAGQKEKNGAEERGAVVGEYVVGEAHEEQVFLIGLTTDGGMLKSYSKSKGDNQVNNDKDDIGEREVSSNFRMKGEL